MQVKSHNTRSRKRSLEPELQNAKKRFCPASPRTATCVNPTVIEIAAPIVTENAAHIVTENAAPNVTEMLLPIVHLSFY